MNSDKLNKEYIEMIKNDEDKYEKDYEKTMEKVNTSKAQYKGKPVPTLYHPMFVTEKDVKDLERIGKGMMDISNKLTERFIDDKDFRKKFGFPKFIEELIEIENGYGLNVPIARFDLFYKDPENFKFCELNTDGSSAMNEDNTLADIMMESLALEDFGKDKTLSSFELFYSWVKESINIYNKTKNPREKPNVAIIDFEESGTPMEFIEFQNAYKEEGYNCIIADPRNLTYKDGNLYADDYRIDLVYRRIVSFELIKKRDEIKDFLDAYRDRAFVCIGSIRSQVIHNKIFFKILHDEDTLNYLNEEERDFVKKHIPYTGIFGGSEDVFKKVLEGKDKYIMKPMDLNASQGVYVGRDFTREEWEKKIREDFDRDYLYQEYFDPFERDFLLKTEDGFDVESFMTTIGLYMYNEKLKGLYSRIGQETIISGMVRYFTLPNILVK